MVLPMLLGIANFDAVESWEVAVHNEQSVVLHSIDIRGGFLRP